MIIEQNTNYAYKLKYEPTSVRVILNWKPFVSDMENSLIVQKQKRRDCRAFVFRHLEAHGRGHISHSQGLPTRLKEALFGYRGAE